VSLELVRFHPLTVSIKVTNNGPSPVTVLSWNSPLDPLAHQLGLLGFTPRGASSPLDLPTIKVSREVPPRPEALIVLEPGESRAQEVEVNDTMLPAATIFSSEEKTTIRCRGEWTAVWSRRASELGEHELTMLGAGCDALVGTFESEGMEISSV